MTAWPDLVMAAVLGTERQAPPLPPAGTPLGDLLAPLAGGTPAATLLRAAGATALYGRVGRLPARHGVPRGAPAAAESRPRCNSTAAQHLKTMLNGHDRDVLPEWLALATGGGWRVPEEQVPALLDLARAQPALAEAVQTVAGECGRWLARQNPDWALFAPSVGTEETTWLTGLPPARLGLLARLRRTDPALARQLVESTWSEDGPDQRAAFLMTFAVGLSGDDEPFLEAALDDRRKEVRHQASELLARLPESRLVGRMRTRALPLLAFAPGASRSLAVLKGRKPALTVTLPDTCDKEMQRDGIEPKSVAGHGERAWWLVQMLGRIPPSDWSARWAVAPAELVAAATAGEWRVPVLQGWAAAARLYWDAPWAEALLGAWRQHGADFAAQGLLAVLPPARREALLGELLDAVPDIVYDERHGFTLLDDCPAPWGAALTRAVLASVQARVGAARSVFDWPVRQVLSTLGERGAPALAQEAAHGWPAGTTGWREAIEESLALLQFRQAMYSALAPLDGTATGVE